MSAESKEPEEKPYVGSDGKSVKLAKSKLLSTTPWYADKVDEKAESPNYDAKRDKYADYDPETYSQILNEFSKKKKKRKAKLADKSPADNAVYDSYARVHQTESKRDRKDTAHYLKNLIEHDGLEFDPPRELRDPGTDKDT